MTILPVNQVFSFIFVSMLYSGYTPLRAIKISVRHTQSGIDSPISILRRRSKIWYRTITHSPGRGTQYFLLTTAMTKEISDKHCWRSAQKAKLMSYKQSLTGREGRLGRSTECFSSKYRSQLNSRGYGSSFRCGCQSREERMLSGHAR